MSSREWIFRMGDILRAIEKIEQYTSRMTLIKFKKNDLIIDAVIRNFEILGEASKSIPLSVQRSYPQIPWKEMKGMRDILIHQYFGVDTKILWHTLKKQLPSLKSQLKNLLQDFDKHRLSTSKK
jgi:uncharacterized protein with HEPN domain